ncbi:TPA: Ig-like domain-containing protein [Vibrio parahaemolyticus]|uniref:Ig-like domain-containing protein n=1 Tax=Vibrio parahaemolyticus TaxID=670 RepID=UPI00235FE0BD|nr:Ig-like domain-containing protein [Vibrio parahaemolyticus]HCM1333070.1 Ig-like domain-containing protein [Vibrio parahaemolyticus]
MKTLWFYTITLLSLLLVGCNNGDDGLLDIPSGWSHNAASLVVTPKNESVPLGLTQQMHADAVLQNSAVVDVTTNEALTWRSSDPAIATIDGNGLLKGMATGTVTITAEGVNNDGSIVKDTATLTVTGAVVKALQVTPTNEMTPVGLIKAFTAKATFTDNSTRIVTNDPAISWSSSDTGIASIITGQASGNGVAKGEKPGTVTITAKGTAGGTTFEGSATLTVTDAVVQRLQVTPTTETTPVGLSKTFVAMAFFSDNSSLDVTNDPALSWSSSDNAIASISSGETSGNGVAKGESEGEVIIKASGIANGQTFEDSAALTVTSAEVASMVVTPSNAMTPNGLTKAFTATVTLTDGTPIDVTNDPAISWSSSDTSIATIETGNTSGGNGVATGVETGMVMITATGSANGTTLTESAELTVTDAVITDLQVTPANDTTPIGLSKQFTAIALLSDGVETLDVTNESAISWSSSNTSIATIDASGLATGSSTGIVTITAHGTTSEGTNVVGTATLEVTDAIVTSLVVTPKDKSVAKGLEQQFTATAYLSDGTNSIDVTNDPSISWTTDDASVSISATGLAKGEAVGSANITALGTTPEGNTLSDSGELTVTDAVVMELQVTPPNDSTPAGLTKQFTATALMSDGSSVPATDNALVSWTSSDTDIATITTGLASGNGVATGVVSGTVSITAEGTIDSTTFKGEATLEVTDAIAQSLTVTPLDPSIAKGLNQQFVAEITYSDKSTNIVTTDPSTNWSSDVTGVATITADGLAHGVETGTAMITAGGTYDGVALQDSTSLTVTAAEMLSIDVTPAISSIAKGLSQQFTAIATFTDGTQDITTDSGTSWVSTNTAAVTISTAGADMGLASGDAVGSTTIQATNAGMTGTASLEVTSAELVSIDLEPDPLSVEEGKTGLLTALGTYTDTATDADRVDITSDMDGWTPVDTGIATVVDGTVTGVKFGSTTVTATKDGVTSAPATINVTPTLVSITISPDNIYLSGGDREFLTALAEYSDGTTNVDVTSSVVWNVEDPTVVNITSTNSGIVEGGSISYGTTQITASLDSVTSNEITITACNDLIGACVDKVDVGSGKLFTSGPSVAFSDAIGVPYSSGSEGFARYNFDQMAVLCETYNSIALFERTNWRAAITSELLDELYLNHVNLEGERGWSMALRYYSGAETPLESVDLEAGVAYSVPNPLNSYLVSCVSEP